MKLMLQNADNFEILSLEDLSRVIPDNLPGKPLNYGQGEGQVEINGTIWGFYVHEKSMYYMAFEEGKLDWHSLNTLVESIVSKIDDSFGVSAQIQVEGPFTDRDDV